MRTKWQRREAGTGLLFLLPSLAGFLLFSLVPFVIMIGKSFTQGVGRIRFVGLANYADLLHNDVFLLAAKNTLRFEAVCVPLICILSFFIALGLQKIPKFWLRAAIILPLVIPAASVSMIFNILVADGGGAQKFLALFGMEEASILHSPAIVLCARRVLSVEEHRLHRHPLPRGAERDPEGIRTGREHRRRKQRADPALYHDPAHRADGVSRVHHRHHPLLQLLSGGLSAGRCLSAHQHLYAPAFHAE